MNNPPLTLQGIIERIANGERDVDTILHLLNVLAHGEEGFTHSNVTEEGLQSFWAKIAELHPTAKTGDLSVHLAIRLQKAADEAVQEWIMNNVSGRRE